jgi:cytochrome c551/c552
VTKSTDQTAGRILSILVLGLVAALIVAVLWGRKPNAQFVEVAGAAWRVPEHLQADLLPAHPFVYDAVAEAPMLAEGRHLFISLGCADCHACPQIPDYEKRLVGPDLRHISAKLSPTMAATWILSPQKFKPSTLMPQCLRDQSPVSAGQARAIASYLFANAEPLEQPDIPPGLDTAEEASYARGQALFRGDGLQGALQAGIGCLGCHRNLSDWTVGGVPVIVDQMLREGSSPGQAAGLFYQMSFNARQIYAAHHLGDTFVRHGPEISEIGTMLTTGRTVDQARQWIFSWLKNPRHYSGYTIMPNLRLDDQEAYDLSSYLLAQRRQTLDPNWQPIDPPGWPPTQDEVALGRQLIVHYGCMNCHQIDGIPRQEQEDLSFLGHKAASQADPNWVEHHLTGPIVVRPMTQAQMPHFDLSAEQTHALATFLLGESEPVNESIAGPLARSLARGRAIVLKYNCVGCHRFETGQALPPIDQFFDPVLQSTYAPPNLRGEGNKVQPPWLAEFLQNIRPLRPLVKMRMPSFPLAESSDLPDLLDYFHASSIKESQHLVGWMNADRQQRLIQWALANGQAARVDLVEPFSTPRQIERTYHEIFLKVRFTADLYDVPDESQQPNASMTDADFARGEKMLQTLQCLNCHVMAPEGASVDMTNAKSINLDLAYRRLERRWVRAWLVEPSVVVAGTNMPAYFSGLSADCPAGRPIAEALGIKDPAKIAALSQFGTTVDQQTDLLIDFLYAAGQRGYATTPKPELNVLLNP